MHHDELRRIPRVKVCCRADVRDRFSVWTAVTDDVCSRGCRLVTSRLPRVGARLSLTLSSDLFPEALEVTAYVAWATDRHVGVNFVATATRAGAPSPADWVDRLVAHGKVLRPAPVGSTGSRLVPSVRRPGAAPRANARAPHVTVRDGTGLEEPLGLPLQHG